MGADVKFISLGVVYNVFEVVMRNTVTRSTHHIVGQFARSAVHSVQSATLRTYPQSTPFIFGHVSHKRITQAVFAVDVGRIKCKEVVVGVKIVYTAIISTHPKGAKFIFKYGKHRRMADAIRVIGMGIDLKNTSFRVIFVQSKKCA